MKERRGVRRPRARTGLFPREPGTAGCSSGKSSVGPGPCEDGRGRAGAVGMPGTARRRRRAQRPGGGVCRARAAGTAPGLGRRVGRHGRQPLRRYLPSGRAEERVSPLSRPCSLAPHRRVPLEARRGLASPPGTGAAALREERGSTCPVRSPRRAALPPDSPRSALPCTGLEPALREKPLRSPGLQGT